MPRGPRISYPNAVFHIINRFIDGHPFFEKSKDYAIFLDTYFEEANTFDIWTYAYTVMPNHFHIVVETPSGEISRFLQRFLSRVAQRLNKKYNRVGHLFQGRSKTLIIQTELYFKTAIGYVLLNPVRAKLANDIFSYPWSSAGEMLNLEGGRIRRDKLWEYLFEKEFDLSNIDSEIKRCITWLKEIDLKGNKIEFNEGHKGAFLSSREFRDNILKKEERRGKSLKNEFRRKKDRKKYMWNWDTICESAVEVIKNDSWKGIWRNKNVAVRHISWYVAYVGAGWSLKQIHQKQNEPGASHSHYNMPIRNIRINPAKKAKSEEAIQLCKEKSEIGKL